MKLIIPAIAFFLFTLAACEKEITKTVTVERDCTGTYLRYEGKDFHICNPEKVESFADGAIVTVTFKKITQCNGSAKDAVVCMMYHENEGWVEIDKIK